MRRSYAYTIIGAAVAVVIVILVASRGGGNNDFESVEVQPMDLVQEVAVTGRVEPKEKVELSFEVAGRVSRVYAGVGDAIPRGGRLVALENSELVASLREAEARLLAEELRLQDLQTGERPEDIAIARSDRDKAVQDLNNYYQDVPTVLSEVVNAIDSTLSNHLGQLFTNDDSTSPKLSFGSSNQVRKVDAENKRARASLARDRVRTLVLGLGTSESARDTTLQSVRVEMQVFEDLLDSLSLLLAESGLSPSTRSTYQNSVSLGRTAINAEVEALDNLIQNIASQKITVARAEEDLIKTETGSTPEELAVAQAVVQQAQASVDLARAQLAKTILLSPISGTVTLQEATVGEIISAREIITTVIDQDAFQIETNVPEADITLVTLGDTARVTLDAYGDEETFAAAVVAIDPAETVIDGVSTYEVTLEFVDDRGLVRSGMTANVDVLTAKLTNVLAVPSRAVITRDNKRYVRLVTNNGSYEETEVEVGLRDSFGNVEVLSGLAPGDEVVTFIP